MRSWTRSANSNANLTSDISCADDSPACGPSYRVGVYRIIYELRDHKTVRVVAIRHRGNAYGSDPR